jgi:DNA-binding protein YbaB
MRSGISRSIAAGALGALAAQHQALALQRAQAQQMQQAQQLEQDQAAAQRHHCQPGYTGAVIVHADGTRQLICERR